MILLPIGRDESTIQRHAWISYSIIGMNVLIFVVTTVMTSMARNEAHFTVTSALTFIVRHPYLTVPPPLAELLPEGVEQQLRSVHKVEAPVRSVIQAQQEELDRLSARATEALQRLPNRRFGFVPGQARLSTAVSSMFLHGGLAHLIGNLLFFFLSGPFVEDVFGRPLFLLLYLTGGGAATLTYWAQHPTSMIPLVGASGAIAAVMGAYLVRFVRSKIEFICIPIWFRPTLNFRFFVPAFVVLPLWFLQQYFEMRYTEAGSGVAFSAHVGGFIFGVVFALIIKISQVEEKLIAPKIKDEISWEIDPRIAAAMTSRANFDFEGARRALEPVLREKPGDLDALRTAIDIAQAAEDAAALDVHGSRLLSRLAEMKDDDGVIGLIHELSAQVDPKRLPRFMSRAAAFVERNGDRDWALILYETAVQADPSGPGAIVSLIKLGSIRKSRGDMAGARSAFEEARAHPKCSPEWESTIAARLRELAP